MRDELRNGPGSPLAAEQVPEGAGPAPEDGFLRDFRAKAERVVIPAMAEAGRLVEARGRFFSIERIAERTTCRGVPVPPSVQMNVFRRHRTVNFKNGAPHFNVVCDRAGRRVLFRRTLLLSGVAAEDVGSCALDALTRGLVQEKVAAMLAVLARA